MYGLMWLADTFWLWFLLVLFHWSFCFCGWFGFILFNFILLDFVLIWFRVLKLKKIVKLSLKIHTI